MYQRGRVYLCNLQYRRHNSTPTDSDVVFECRQGSRSQLGIKLQFSQLIKCSNQSIVGTILSLECLQDTYSLAHTFEQSMSKSLRDKQS
jgi:hypothetical protein